jgi:hypothetical protein
MQVQMASLRRRMSVYRDKSDGTGKLMSALAAAQAKFAPIERETEADWGMFASLNSMIRATKPALTDHGLAVHNEYQCIDGQLYLVTVLTHGESDEWVSSLLPIKTMDDTQDTVAYMTTMRRVNYAAILCLAPEDEKRAEQAIANADAKAASEDKDEQYRLAKDAIAAAMNAERLASILAKAESRAAAGKMDPAHIPELLKSAQKREKELAAMVAKASAPPAQPKKPQEVSA